MTMACTRTNVRERPASIRQKQLWDKMFPEVKPSTEHGHRDSFDGTRLDLGVRRDSRRCSAIDLSTGVMMRRRLALQEDAKRSSLMVEVKQSYDDLRKQCIREKRLFEDRDFPAVDSSIFDSRKTNKQFQWKRPGEICRNPQFYVDGASRFDVHQGEIGNCWFVAALSCLVEFPKEFDKVVPPDDCHSFDASRGYAGIFRFRFYTFGEWTDVVIDDRLPTLNNRLVFVQSPEKNEFWSSLFEKAYAKLNGSYEHLISGSSSEAMIDFTGGVTEIVDLRRSLPLTVFDIVMKAHQKESLMAASIESASLKIEDALPNGLRVQHSYSITGICEVAVPSSSSSTPRRHPLVRLRNPWGNDCEWNGAWSDKSREWNIVPISERQRIGMVVKDDGEFWMSLEDFSKNFTSVEICHLAPDTSENEKLSGERWQMSSHYGSWKANVNAGGCSNYKDTYWTNPQYHITVDEVDDSNRGNQADNKSAKCTLLVALMQRERRTTATDLLEIGYSIYKLETKHNGPLDSAFFRQHAAIAVVPSFINMREVCGRHKLAPGTYCVVPSTFEPGLEGDFLLRLFTEKPMLSKELDEETTIRQIQIDRPIKPQMDAAEKAQRDIFTKIAGDDLEVDAEELQGVLNKMFSRDFLTGFSIETCRSLVAMNDVDFSGKLGFEEFKKLWIDIKFWMQEYKKTIRDSSGQLNSYEFRETLARSGFRVNNAIFESLVRRYGGKDGKISIEDYVHCIARLSTMYEIFQARSPNFSAVEFTLNEFLATTMYS